MKKKLLPISLLCFLGIAALVGCNNNNQPVNPDPGPGPVDPEPEDVSVTGVSLNKEALQLVAGASEKLVATVAPADATNKNVSWSSANERVATVDAQGNVTAVAVGETEVTVSTVDGNYVARCAVKVVLEGVQITITNAAAFEAGINKGSSIKLELEITPAVNVNDLLSKGYLKVTSSNTDVATVSGLTVYGIEQGEANITVTLFDGTAQVALTVGGETPEPAEQKITVSNLLAAWDSEHLGTQLYVLENVYVRAWASGKTDGTKYGNFYIADSLEEEADQLYVYGSTASLKSGEDDVISWNGGDAKYNAFKNPQDFLTNELTKDITIKSKLTIKVFTLEYNGTKELNGIITAVDHSEEDTTVYPEPTEFAEKTLAEFVALENSAANAYMISGTVTGFKNGGDTADQYGNLVIKQDETSVVVYGSTATATALAWNEKMGVFGFTNPQDFLTDELTKDIKIGDVVTMKAIRADYQGTVQCKGIITKVEAGVAPETPEPEITVRTLAEFIAGENVKTVAYSVTANIKAFKNGETKDKFGNMTLTDGEHDLVIYGATMTATALVWNGAGATYAFTNPQDFLTNETTNGLAIGDEITMTLIRCDYSKDGVTTIEGQGIITKVPEAPAPTEVAIKFGSENNGDDADAACKNPGEYRYWADGNWCGSSVTVSKAVIVDEKAIVAEFTSTGECNFGFQLFYKNAELVVGKKYVISYDVTVENACTITMQGIKEDHSSDRELAAGVKTHVSIDYVEAAATASFAFIVPVKDGTANKFTIENIKWEEYVEPTTLDLVTTDTITEGTFAIFFNGAACKAVIDSNRLGLFEVEAAENKLAVNEPLALYEFAQVEGGWSIFNKEANKFLASTGTKNQAALVDEVTDKAVWTITAIEGGFDIVNNSNEAAGINSHLRRNGNFGFATYGASMGGAISLFKLGGQEAPETPVELPLPVGNFSGFAVALDDSNVFVNVALGAEKAFIEVGSEKVTTTYAFDKATGLVTIVLGGNYGNLTATFDSENAKLVNVGIDGAAAATLKNNNEIILESAKAFFDCDGTTAELQAQFLRRYMQGSWQEDSTNDDRLVSVENSVSGTAMQRRGWTGGAVALNLMTNFEGGLEVSNIGFWVFNPGENDIALRQWVYKNDNRFGDTKVEIGNVTAKAGQWTYCRMGFTKATIYNFQVADFNNSGVALIFDNIALF